MPSELKKKSHLVVLGVHVKSDGYPNVKYRVESLLSRNDIVVTEVNVPFRPVDNELALWGRGRFSKLRMIMHAAWANIAAIAKYYRGGRGDAIYIPYPAWGLLLFFSILPRAWRPSKVLVDAFISIFDTLVLDRRLLTINGLPAKIVRMLETRALRVADLVIVDTSANAIFFAEKLQLDPSRVVAQPLAIDTRYFSPEPYNISGEYCQVLFLGTFVPLQGVDTIARAAVLLRKHREIHFKIIGSGQMKPHVASILNAADGHQVEWISDWQGKDVIRRAIVEADICLGIFGAGEKAGRVWPFKNYHYMAIGRPIITGDTMQARTMLGKNGEAPFVTVPCNDPDALAAAILSLSGLPEKRRHLAVMASRYFQDHLAARQAEDQILSKIGLI